MRGRSTSALVALCLLAPAGARAQVLYDNGAPGSGGGIEVTIRVLAEDLVLEGDATVTRVRFWAAEDLGAWSGTIEYFFFANAGNVPAEVPFASGEAQQIEVVPGNGTDRYTFALETPLELDAGVVYWLGLHMDDDFDDGTSCCVFWTQLASGAEVGSGAASATAGFFTNWGVTPNHHAFQLLPEPGESALTAAALVTLGALAARARRRRATAGCR